jgi:hypothetical protein
MEKFPNGFDFMMNSSGCEVRGMRGPVIRAVWNDTKEVRVLVVIFGETKDLLFPSLAEYGGRAKSVTGVPAFP